MDVVELAKLGKQMREAQNRFFRGDRDATAVRIAKDWERRFDRAVEEVLGAGQPSLFLEED